MRAPSVLGTGFGCADGGGRRGRSSLPLRGTGNKRLPRGNPLIRREAADATHKDCYCSVWRSFPWVFV